MLPETSTATIQIVLDRIPATLDKDEIAAMHLGGAGWHASKRLTVPANVILLKLPPGSPGLNPVERLWLYLKARHLSHRLPGDYGAIVKATCGAWNRTTAGVGRILPLCSYPWLGKLVATTVRT